jgi:hypothetical protein
MAGEARREGAPKSGDWREERFRVIVRGVPAGAIVLGFLGLPLVRFASPTNLFVAGFLLAAGTVVAQVMLEERHLPASGIMTLVLAAAALLYLLMYSDGAREAATANDRRC